MLRFTDHNVQAASCDGNCGQCPFNRQHLAGRADSLEGAAADKARRKAEALDPAKSEMKVR